MAAEIRTIKDGDTQVLPRTSARAVKMEDGYSLEEALAGKLPKPMGAAGQLLGFTAENMVGAVENRVGEYNKTIKAKYPVKAGETVRAGDVVDVVGGTVTCCDPIGDLPVGTAIWLDEDSGPAEYLIVHKGRPSTIYDTSCDGAWVLRKDIVGTSVWDSGDDTNYASSDIKDYLDSVFLQKLSTRVRNAAKQIRIPYRSGSSGGVVNSGTNGVSCKAFILSVYETGANVSYSESAYFPADGAKLSYFTAGQDLEARTKRIAMYNGNPGFWWTRSPYTYSTASKYVWLLSGGGELSRNFNANYPTPFGVRPAMILPNDFRVKKVDIRAKQAIALQSGTGGQSIDVMYDGIAELPGAVAGQEITSDGVYGYCPMDGWLWVRPEWGAPYVTGSYTGGGKHSEDDPVRLDLGFVPKLVFIYPSVGNQLAIITPKTGAFLNLALSSGGSLYGLDVLVTDEGITWFNRMNSPSYTADNVGTVYKYVAFR